MFEKLNNWIYEIKLAWQRVFRGWDDTVYCSLDAWLIEILPPILRKLKKNKCSCPADMFDAGMKKWKKKYPNSKLKKNECWQFDIVLKKIITGFEAAKKLMDCQYMKKVKIKKPWTNVLGEKVFYKYEVDKKLLKKLETQWDEGSKLFIKYFFALWT